MFRRRLVRPRGDMPEGFDCMVVLTDVPQVPTRDYVEGVIARIQSAPRLARAGEIVYAHDPVSPRRGPRSRGGRPMPRRGAPPHRMLDGWVHDRGATDVSEQRPALPSDRPDAGNA